MDRRQLLPIVDGIVDSVDDYTNGDDNHNDYNGNNSNNNNIYINNHLRRQSVSTRLQQFVQLQYPQQLHYRPATIATAELLFNTPDSLVGSNNYYSRLPNSAGDSGLFQMMASECLVPLSPLATDNNSGGSNNSKTEWPMTSPASISCSLQQQQPLIAGSTFNSHAHYSASVKHSQPLHRLQQNNLMTMAAEHPANDDTDSLLNQQPLKRPSRRSKSHQCENCLVESAPTWRKSPTGGRLCNACGLYLKLHGKHRKLANINGCIRVERTKKGGKSTSTVAVGSHAVGSNHLVHCTGCLIMPLIPNDPSWHRDMDSHYWCDSCYRTIVSLSDSV